MKQYPPELQAPFMAPHLSFKVVVESFGRGVKMEEQKEKIDQFSYLPIQVWSASQTPSKPLLTSLRNCGNKSAPVPVSIPSISNVHLLEKIELREPRASFWSLGWGSVDIRNESGCKKGGQKM